MVDYPICSIVSFGTLVHAVCRFAHVISIHTSGITETVIQMRQDGISHREWTSPRQWPYPRWYDVYGKNEKRHRSVWRRLRNNSRAWFNSIRKVTSESSRQCNNVEYSMQIGSHSNLKSETVLTHEEDIIVGDPSFRQRIGFDKEAYVSLYKTTSWCVVQLYLEHFGLRGSKLLGNT